MKVRKQTIYGFKLVAWGNKEIGLAATLSASGLALQGTQTGSAYRNNSATIFLVASIASNVSLGMENHS